MAGAYCNGDFVCLKTYSGYRLALMDPEASEYLLTFDVQNEVLGNAILSCLSESRFLDYEESQKLRLNTKENYQNWVAKMQSLYGYKTKSALFKKMMSCGIQLENDNAIVIRPSNHEKLEAWSGDGIRESDYVKISADSPPAEIGAALRLAFSRCLGPKP